MISVTAALLGPTYYGAKRIHISHMPAGAAVHATIDGSCTDFDLVIEPKLEGAANSQRVFRVDEAQHAGTIGGLRREARMSVNFGPGFHAATGERYGISYYVVPDGSLDMVAPIVARLAGVW